MNPRAAINDLLPFQGSPFSRLGTSPKVAELEIHYVKYVVTNRRRGWDSNPCALADKRFSRPPRYDHFDTSPKVTIFGRRKLDFNIKNNPCQPLYYIFSTKFCIFFLYNSNYFKKAHKSLSADGIYQYYYGYTYRNNNSEKHICYRSRKY